MVDPYDYRHRPPRGAGAGKLLDRRMEVPATGKEGASSKAFWPSNM